MPVRGGTHDRRLQGFEVLAVRRDEFLVIEVLGDEHVHDAVEKGHVRPDLDLRKDVGLLGEHVFPWVDHDERGALVHGPFDEIGGHGVGLGHVGADQEEELGVFKFAERVGHGARTEGGGQTGHGRGVSGSCAVIDVVGADHRAEELLHVVRVFVGAPRAAHPGDRVRPDSRMICWNLLATRSRASSQLASRKPSPSRMSGVVRRSWE